MICVDEEALICDLAETYHIYDYRQLSPKTVAVFSVGLNEQSRIKLKLAGLNVPINTLLLAQIVDSINTLVWMNSSDCRNKAKRPKSIAEALQNIDKKEDKPMAFDSGDVFMKYRHELLRKGGHIL